ncbi:MAG: PEP-utilizing enzyme [Planctomycetota bacterium]
MRWHSLRSFRDASIPKLAHLQRADAAGLVVPPTVWAPADRLPAEQPPLGTLPWIVRSASPHEDQQGSSQAGRFHSEVVADAGALADAVQRVATSLGSAGGAVFVQPFLASERAGVVFSDGFYFERAESDHDNTALTAGAERGEVTRSHLDRAGAWSDWLHELHRAFPDLPHLDAEFARDGEDYTLLQVRAAAFPIRRNELLSLANHREILGDPPSPWLVDALAQAGTEATRYFSEVDPRVEPWREPYAIAVAERAWLNFSFFFRLMDHWGLPRSFVTEGVGGEGEGPQGSSLRLGRMLRSAPALLRLQWQNRRTMRAIERNLAAWRAEVDAAEDIDALFDATVSGLALALRTNFAINGALSGIARVRRWLRIPGQAEVVTERMRRDYEELRGQPEGLDRWLGRYGHRGPLESDPMQPRFRELRAELARDLASGPTRAAPPAPRRHRWTAPFFAIDRKREWFRDELMRHWERLRERILQIADDPDTVFFRGRRAAWEQARTQVVPSTARRDAIEADAPRPAVAHDRFEGIALHDHLARGRARKARALDELLRSETPLDADTILVVPALEPAWGILFGRVVGVVAELGGELSHAAILLREAGTPAILNCPGLYAAVEEGEELVLDGARGVVMRPDPRAAPKTLPAS